MHELSGARTRVVAADRGITAMQLAELKAVIGLFSRCQRLLDRAQLGIAVEHEIDGRAIARQQFLRDMGDRELRGHVEAAGLGLHFPAHERQQARLATAVLTGDADFLAAKQAEGGAGEQHALAAADAEIGEVEHERARSL